MTEVDQLRDGASGRWMDVEIERTHGTVADDVGNRAETRDQVLK